MSGLPAGAGMETAPLEAREHRCATLEGPWFATDVRFDRAALP